MICSKKTISNSLSVRERNAGNAGQIQLVKPSSRFLSRMGSRIMREISNSIVFVYGFHVQAPFAFPSPKSGTYVVQFRYGALFFVECRWPQAVLMAYISFSPMLEM